MKTSARRTHIEHLVAHAIAPLRHGQPLLRLSEQLGVPKRIAKGKGGERGKKLGKKWGGAATIEVTLDDVKNGAHTHTLLACTRCHISSRTTIKQMWALTMIDPPSATLARP